MKLSKSLIDDSVYKIPENLDDSKNIDKFLSSNKDKPVVVVQGLGFVGSVMSLVCANSIKNEYSVIGIDLPNEKSFWKICSINDGVFPVVSSDKKVESFFEESKKRGNLYATYDTHAYKKADIVIVDINLDVAKESSEFKDLESYDVDLSGFKKAIRSIGKNCKEGIFVLIETTVPPGSTKIAYDILHQEMTQRGLDATNLFVGHSYERVMPGPNYIDSIQNFYRVYSGINEESAEKTKNFLETIISTKKYPLTKLKNTNSTELSKVLENSYRAMNISFIVEWSRFAEEAGVDLYEVVNAIRMRPTHKNIMLPGIGVGGYCLTKDPLLASWAKQNIFSSIEPLTMSEESVRTNDKMPEKAFNFLKSSFGKSLDGKKILLLGISYLPDVGDTRYTPVELFYKYLAGENCIINLHDPFIKFWEEIDIEISNDYSCLEDDTDIVVISTGHSEYKSQDGFLKKIMNTHKLFILDTVGLLNEKQIADLKTIHDVKVLGRGDI